MRQSARVVLLTEIRVYIDGGSIPASTECVIATKIAGGQNTFEVDVDEPGMAIRDTNDLRVIKE